jgi:hypothetical protein
MCKKCQDRKLLSKTNWRHRIVASTTGSDPVNLGSIPSDAFVYLHVFGVSFSRYAF